MVPQQVCQQHAQHNNGHRDIEPVSLSGKGRHREQHTRNGRRDQQQDAELDDRATVERKRSLHDPGDGATVGRLAPAVAPSVVAISSSMPTRMLLKPSLT